MLIFFGVFILFTKHSVGNDSSVSDWLINYSGGFVRRGLAGQLVLEFTKISSLNLRDAILIFQTFFFVLYYLLISYFLNNISINRILLLSIFAPIFVLYPIAEIEAFGRKELLVFFINIISFVEFKRF